MRVQSGVLRSVLIERVICARFSGVSELVWGLENRETCGGKHWTEAFSGLNRHSLVCASTPDENCDQ